ncbi:MAG: hypothetical protein ACM37W_28150 [Actinomycetota bacterium]
MTSSRCGISNVIIILKQLEIITLSAILALGGSALGSTAPLPISKTSQLLASSTTLPMELGFDEGFGSIVVPESDTTASAYGERLRRYDVHIAKMFEVTHFMCQRQLVSPSITWNYAAGGGRINMGTFEISCRLASQVASAYGLGKSEPTNITFSAGEMGRQIRSFNIPILDITGNKVPRWINFVQEFKPVRR